MSKRQEAQKERQGNNKTNSAAQPNSNRTKQKDMNQKDYLFLGGLPENFQEYEDRQKFCLCFKK